MIAFALLYLLEGSIRKYIIASTLTLLPKYVYLFYFFAKNAANVRHFALAVWLLPLLFLVPSSIEALPFAIYDFLTIALVPCLIIAIVYARPDILYKKKLIKICFWGGIANSSLIILQFFAGPRHFLSQTVDQQFTQHTYVGTLFQKAPGIAASSSAYITVAGLIATIWLLNTSGFPRSLLRLSISLACLSVMSNLTSRSYAFGVLLFFAIHYTFVFFLTNRKLAALWPIIASASLMPVYNLLNSSIEGFDSANRSVNDFGSVWDRIPSFIPLEQASFELPLLGGLGLGSTVNNNPFVEISFLPQCQSFFSEYEFTRYVCSFGWFGYIVVFTRWAVCILLARKLFFHIGKKHALSSASLSYLIVILFWGAPLKINDVSSGLLLIAIASLSASSYHKDG